MILKIVPTLIVICFLILLTGMVANLIKFVKHGGEETKKIEIKTNWEHGYEKWTCVIGGSDYFKIFRQEDEGDRVAYRAFGDLAGNIIDFGTYKSLSDAIIKIEEAIKGIVDVVNKWEGKK